jgi:hypothetical protein
MEGYRKAIEMAGFLLPPTVADKDHSILKAEPVWFEHSTVGDVRFLSPKSLY